MSVKYHYLMLCSPADLANKSIPSDLKQIVNLADSVTRDLIATFALIEFRTLLKGGADLAFLKRMPAAQPSFQLGNKIQLEGIMLLPCLYYEAGSAKQVFVGFSDNNILLAEQIKDDFKFGKVIFIEDLLAVGLTKHDKRLLITSLEVRCSEPDRKESGASFFRPVDGQRDREAQRDFHRRGEKAVFQAARRSLRRDGQGVRLKANCDKRKIFICGD